MFRKILLLLICASAGSGCVVRTVTDEPKVRGSDPSGKYGSKMSDGKVIEKKMIWIWEDEFKNPK